MLSTIGNNKIATFDIESIEWTTSFLCGGYYNGTDYYYSWDEKDFFRYLIAQENTTIYAHNGGKFDFLWLLSVAISMGCRPNIVLQGTRILSIEIGNVEFLDSYALIPMSLEKAGGMVGQGKVDLPFDYSEFGSLTRSQKTILLEYLEQDCRLLYDVLEYLFTYAARHDIAIRKTVASTSWRTVKSWLNIPNCQWSPTTYARLREGYYGGRTEVYKTQTKSGHRYDRNSSYPAALHNTALPIPPAEYTLNPVSDFRDGKEGIYTAHVYVPEMNIPPLPIRTKTRLYFPVGDLFGTWTGLELRYAIQCGCQVLKITNGITFETSKVIFDKAIQKIWRLRKNADTKALNSWIKWLANSLTGKFAQRPEFEVITFGERPNDDARALDPYGDFFAHKVERIDGCCWVQWAAYLTSEARISLHDALKNARGPCYCDTDSVYCEHMTRHTNIGPGLGQWGYEGPMENWEAAAPKMYNYFDGKKNVYRAKGIPQINEKVWGMLTSGQTYTKRQGARLFKTSVKEGVYWGPNAIKTLKKSLCPNEKWCGGRLRAKTETTRPPTYNQAIEREG
jgi:hypothetical protein